MKGLNKKFGERSVQILSGDEPPPDIPFASTGSFKLDLAISNGKGLPIGRVIEIWGPQAAGKSTILMLHLIEVQKAYPNDFVCLIDMEHSFNWDLALAYGLDRTRFIINQPSTAEEGLDIAEAFVRSGRVRCIGIDSVAAMAPEAEVEADMGTQSMGLLARLMSKALRKLTPICEEKNCSIVFINQIREKIGQMFGNPETTPGGRALGFFSSVRIKVTTGEPIKDGDKQVGHNIVAKVMKNKVGMPFRQATFPLLYGVGIDPAIELAQICEDAEIVTKSGNTWILYTMDDGSEEFKFQGKVKFQQALRENTALREELTCKARGAS